MTVYRNVTVQEDGTITGESSHNALWWHKFSGHPDLMKIRHVLDEESDGYVLRRFYALQDGYGRTGYIPPQGYDWSGIRDSSEEAIAKMVKLAEEIHGDEPWPWEE
jgi:hypothetical protein